MASEAPRANRRGGRRAVAALFVLVVLGAVTACSSTGSGTVSLETLVDRAASYDGHIVTVEGDVHRFQDGPGSPPYLVLENAANDRVLLMPTDLLRPYVDQRIRVQGCFTYSSRTGQRLDVYRVITPARSEPPAAAASQHCSRTGSSL